MITKELRKHRESVRKSRIRRIQRANMKNPRIDIDSAIDSLYKHVAGQELSCSEIAFYTGITPERISKITMRALAKLKPLTGDWL